MSLSDKIFGSEDFDNDQFQEIEVLHIDNVKEAVKELKDLVKTNWNWESVIEFNKRIDKIFGDKLI